MGRKSEQRINSLKRYSKISNALKSYFFTLVYRKQMTIKDSARICRLNYSTAKAIIRDLNSNEINQSKMCKKFKFEENYQRSDYRQTSSYNSNEYICYHEKQGKISNYQGLKMPQPAKKINIISTIGYDFLNPSNNYTKNH